VTETFALPDGKTGAYHTELLKRTPLGAICGALVVLSFAFGAQAEDKLLIHYNSNSPDFWKHPPPDWFYGDENKDQQGLRGTVGPALPVPMAELNANLKRIKLPPGFHIDVWAQGVPGARQMAWGDKGTLFVGSFLQGVVSAVVEENGHKVVKTVIKGLTLPIGVTFGSGALYVGLPDKILKYENAEANLDHIAPPKVVYGDMPGYIPHGWKYLVMDKEGWIYVPFGPPLQRMPAPDLGVADSTCQSRERNGPAHCHRHTQQRRRRRRSPDWRILVLRKCPRLDQRRSAERQAQPCHTTRREFRLPLLPPGQPA
jgi:glucose/arabinose dehydrogenase